jgi:hypothetical protein
MESSVRCGARPEDGDSNNECLFGAWRSVIRCYAPDGEVAPKPELGTFRGPCAVEVADVQGSTAYRMCTAAAVKHRRRLSLALQKPKQGLRFSDLCRDEFARKQFARPGRVKAEPIKKRRLHLQHVKALSARLSGQADYHLLNPRRVQGHLLLRLEAYARAREHVSSAFASRRLKSLRF